MPFFGPDMTYASMVAVWQKHWGFLESRHYTERAPIFIGEFGTCGISSTCVDDKTPGSQGLWFRFFMRYLESHPQIGWSFWALNGTNPSGVNDPNYVLRRDWHTVRLRALVDTLRDVELPPPPGA
jgi:endoglucanase